MGDYKGSKMEKGAVTFLDVVGWVGIWQRETNALTDLKDMIVELKKVSNEITSRLIGEDKELRGIITEVKSISDTIVFLTQGKPTFSLLVHGELCKHAVALSIQKGIPLRGATSWGEYGCYDNILIGPAIDEAASWHEKGDWFGSILAPSALFSDFTPDGQKIWIDYDSPLNTGKVFKTFCVNWIKSFNEDFELGKKELLKKFHNMSPIGPEIVSKYTNTIKFYEYCKEK